MKYIFPSGSYYEGDIVDECFQGKGIFHFSNGDVYEGEFQNDMFQGTGEYRYKSGAVYRGSFLNDMFHGIGTWMFQDGTIEKGKFYQDKRVGKFIQIENEEYYSIVYDRDKMLKCEKTDASSVSDDKKPKFIH